MQLRDYQRHALQAIASGKHIVVAECGIGKTITGITWAKSTGKTRVLVVTTASVRDQCFTAGNMVMTPNGEVPIEQLQVGDEVMAYDGQRVCVKRVTRAISKIETRPLYSLSCPGHRDIIATYDHPFYVGNGYKRVKDLQKGTNLYAYVESAEGNKENRDRDRRATSSKATIQTARHPQRQGISPCRLDNIQVLDQGRLSSGCYKNTVYCIEVEDCHNYFINGILVHNCNFEQEAKQWYPNWFESLSSFEVVSWAGLAKWAQANWDSLEEYAFIYDEISSCKAGVSSIRGSAFLQITKQSDCWTGWTATPGDRWIDFYAYFVACDKIRNKTEFIREFCVEQQFRGFREIVAYRNTATLNKWWREISCQVDSSEVQKELPGMVHKTINFKKPTGYDKVLKTSTTMDGEFMDNCSAMAHYLRQLCSTKQKLEWIRDFVMNLNQPCLIFYTYNSEGEAIQSAVEQALGIKPIKISGYNGKRLKRPSKRQSARVWRIDGKSHDIPTAETIGQRDVVLAQWQAGAFGLNLQFIHYWISASPCYSYSTSIQARKRIHRIGQTHTCYYYYLLADGTIEEDIYAALKTKSDFAEDVWALAKQQKYNIKWSNNE